MQLNFYSGEIEELFMNPLYTDRGPPMGFAGPGWRRLRTRGWHFFHEYNYTYIYTGRRSTSRKLHIVESTAPYVHPAVTAQASLVPRLSATPNGAPCMSRDGPARARRWEVDLSELFDGPYETVLPSYGKGVLDGLNMDVLEL